MTKTRPNPPLYSPLLASEAVRQFGGIDMSGVFPMRVATRLAADDGTALWWLTYQEPDKDQDAPQTLGVTVVRAPTIADAVARTHTEGINPGGVISVTGPLPVDAIDREWHNRLLTETEAKAIDADRIREAVDTATGAASTGKHSCSCGFSPIVWPCGRCGRVKP